jgi:uncharacterized lipoprotein
MRFMALIAVFCASAVLVGCASHTKDYLKKDQAIGSIVVPPGVPMIKQASYYPVPNLPVQSVSSKTPNLKPPTLR